MTEVKTNETPLLTVESAPEVFEELRRSLYQEDLDGLRNVLKKGLDLTGFEYLLISVKDDVFRELLSHMDVHACSHHFFRAVEYEETSIVNIFLDCGAAAIPNHAGLNALAHVKTEEMFDLLIQRGVDAKKQNDDGQTLAFYIKPKLINKLKTAGLDLDTRDNYGQTAFFVDDSDRIEALKEAGADVHVTDSKGRTPLFFARLPYAIQAYIAAGVDINAVDNDGKTALFDENISFPRANQLLEAGIDPDIQDNDGNTALMCLAPRVVKPAFEEDDPRVEEMSEDAQDEFYDNWETYDAWCCILKKTTELQTENNNHQTIFDLVNDPQILEDVKQLAAERGQEQFLLNAQQKLAAQKADNLQTVLNGWNSRNKRTIAMFQALAFLIETESGDELQKVATFVRQKTENTGRQRSE